MALSSRYQIFMFIGLVIVDRISYAQINIPADAPQPLSPSASVESVHLPDGFSLELVAAEPLIRNPSGVCWDERGRLFVCELNGYNMEGQYDIERLNQTGKLDREVRRVAAPADAVQKAERDQTGSVKHLIDSNGDGIMDRCEVWADDLPACFGLVPARGGVIVICAPDIVYLADHDGDGVAETRNKLFTGFRTGVLERRMSAPRWGLDDWIYVAGGGGEITGPHLDAPVDLPRNDFRFKADGSAIEPLSAGTWTFGFTFSSSGDRYVIATDSPAIYVAPLPWRYLRRNPHAGYGRLTKDVGPGDRCYPVSQPHPWRSRRAADPGFEQLYRTRYGASESTPNGYFTSACSPLVYQDTALPIGGHLLACEPAQNLIHRSTISRAGFIPSLHRTSEEEESEFLASTDIWFHPIALSIDPQGAVVISDFYREIIEDYSAIPRYLQQQYQLKHGEEHGRIWRLVHREMPPAFSSDMSQLDSAQLVAELASTRYWRRQTARRLLIERDDPQVAHLIRTSLATTAPTTDIINSLHTLDGLGELSNDDLSVALRHVDPAVLVQALRLADARFDDAPALLERALTMVNEDDPRVLIQLALSLGESSDWRAGQSLAMLALQSIDTAWMPDALLSSLSGRGADLLQTVFQHAGQDEPTREFAEFTTRLTRMITHRRDDDAISRALLVILDDQNDPKLKLAALAGLRLDGAEPRRAKISKSAEDALRAAGESDQPGIADIARQLIVDWRLETAAQRAARLTKLSERAFDIRFSVDDRIEAVERLAAESNASIDGLLKGFQVSTPAIRKAILAALFARNTNGPRLLAAMESGQLPAATLSAVQREFFMQHSDPSIRTRARRVLDSQNAPDPNRKSRFIAALSGVPNRENGLKVFRKQCSQCHKAQGIGFEVGPSLTAESGRSAESFVYDILAPNAKVTPGYETYLVQSVDGRIFTGLMTTESPTSITLRSEEAKEQTILRQDIEAIRVSETSLMPADLAKQLTPTDLADVIAWLQSPAQP